MFPIHILKDSTSKIPKDDICYLIAKNGIFVKKKLGLIESLTPVDEIPFLKKEVDPYATMKIPKIPKITFAQVLAFFKKVYELHQSESEAYLYYNASKEEYTVRIPHQKVSYASCKSIRGKTPKGYQIVCSIHSHANFGAFHSGTDISDEEYFEGLHITVGNVDDDEFSVVASIVSNRVRFKSDPLDCIEGLIQTVEEDKKLGWKSNSNLYAISGKEKVSFDPNWINFVQKMYPDKTRYKGYKVYQPSLFPYQRFATDLDKKIEAGREEAKKHINDPCLDCPFNKESKEESLIKDWELTLEDWGVPLEEEKANTVKDLFPEEEVLTLDEDLFSGYGCGY